MQPHSAPSQRYPSKANCLFLGFIAAAGCAFTFRKPLTTALTARPPTLARPPITSAARTMYGGGSGISVPSPATPASAAIIFLHGLGDSGLGWASAFPLPGLPHVRAILPSADAQPVSLNMGMRMPSWFDLRGLDETAPDDERGILEAAARVERIVDEQVSDGVPEGRIVVAGFSQGGAVALTYGLRTERRLAGVVALSTWLPMRAQYPEKLSAASEEVRILMGHGTADQVVGFKFGQQSAEMLKEMQRKVDFKSYPGLTHSASPAELADVAAFVASVVPKE